MSTEAAAEGEGLRQELEAAPSGEFPDALTVTAPHHLRLGELRWEDFEQLCYRLARVDAEFEDARRYGTRGQRDEGIDVLMRRRDGRYVVYQCKRYADLTAADIKKAVSSFLDGKWAEVATQLVFCTSFETVPTALANEIRTQTTRLAEHAKPVSFVVWDRSELSAALRNHPRIVLDFFGPHAKAQFFSEPVGGTAEEVARVVVDAISNRAPARIISLDWASSGLRTALDRLHADDPEAFARIMDLGTPASRELVDATISHPPPWLSQSKAEVWDVMARVAQSVGSWQTAAHAWKEASVRQPEDEKIRSLIAGLAAAGVAEDDLAAEEIRAEIERLAPDHVRLKAAKISDDLPGADLLAQLKELAPEHPEDRSLVAGRMCLASMRLPDLDQAREHLRTVEEISADSFSAQFLRVNLEVQQGRVQVLLGEALDAPTLRRTGDQARELRTRLLDERRWGEACRMLMLAADAIALLGERDEASNILKEARDEEIASEDGPIVLGESAIGRALDSELALRFIADADQTNVYVRRIRAEALQRQGTVAERQEALATLEEIVDEGGLVGAEAAVYRLACCIGDRSASWHEPSFELLMSSGFEKPAISVRAFYLAQRHSDYLGADELLAPYLGEMWAKGTRVRLAQTWGKHSILKEAADDIMSVGPTQAFRLEAGRAYALAGEHHRAQEVLINVAKDLSAPPAIRSDAYNYLLRVVGLQLQNWTLARRLYDEWVGLRIDPRQSQYQPLLASRA